MKVSLPKLIWTKRAGNGDVITAQEWLSGRSLTKEEMGSVEVIELLKQIHQSPNLLQMLQQIQGEEYSTQKFIDEYLNNLQSGITNPSFLKRSIKLLN